MFVRSVTKVVKRGLFTYNCAGDTGDQPVSTVYAGGNVSLSNNVNCQVIEGFPMPKN